jgi:putative transcriptional regulator
LLRARDMTLTEISSRADITIANLSVLKNDRARAIRFSTLTALCAALDCQPGDLISYRPVQASRPGTALSATCRDALVPTSADSRYPG